LHEEVASGVTWVELQGTQIPVLDCASLVVFKTFFARGRDWGDIEEVAEATPKDVESALEVVTDLAGKDDPSCRRLAEIAAARKI
jgi:pyrroloquinoline quinone (PQQ) biosynthesis protein C